MLTFYHTCVIFISSGNEGKGNPMENKELEKKWEEESESKKKILTSVVTELINSHFLPKNSDLTITSCSITLELDSQKYSYLQSSLKLNLI